MLPTDNVMHGRARGLRRVSQILLGVQILSLGHLLSVRHVTCPEHGDIIHAQASAGMPAGQLDAGMGALRQHSLAPSEPAAKADHEHCLACVDADHRLLLAGPARAFGDHVFAVSMVDAATTASCTPIDLILLSPKNSPPSA